MAALARRVGLSTVVLVLQAVKHGCLNRSMYNFDKRANTDSGACVMFRYGCTDASSYNHDARANCDRVGQCAGNSSCVARVSAAGHHLD